MKLGNEGLRDKEFWESKGYILPGFDRVRVREYTLREPVWVHFGAGNIFRAFTAILQQRLLDFGLQSAGIIAAEGYDYELVDKAYKPFDNLSIAVTLIPDGSVKKTIVASVVDCVKADSDGLERLREIFASKSLQLVSFTITEKGYNLPRSAMSASEQAALPSDPDSQTFLEKLTSLCLHRYRNGAYPLALVSMDNCSSNGKLLKRAVSHYAQLWADSGIAEGGFPDYVNNPETLSFPCTMIDKITPYPDDGVAKMLGADGVEDMAGFVTAKGSATAPFVNAEEPEYLVVEDIFPNGRPPLEKAGVIFTDRATVDKTEKMKVCTCLNPLHTALSVFACMLGFKRISDAIRDRDLRALVERVAKEGLPVVTDPGVISPSEFIDTVLNVRLPNPYIPDTPQRIATDTSQKLAVRFGETLKAYLNSRDLDVKSLRAVPLVFAGWCRYLLGIDDDGNAFELSPDPLLGELRPLLSGVTLGADVDCDKLLRPILENKEIFGINLYDAGIADEVARYFAMMVKGGIRSTLRYICS